MMNRLIFFLLFGIMFAIWGCSSDEESVNGGYHPVIDPAEFVAGVDNQHFPLQVGRTLHYVNTSAANGDTTVENIAVLTTSDTKIILGVTCMVVHDVVTEDSDTLEDTYDWYAQDVDDNVWYFGEDTRAWDGNQWITEGSWEAGVDGAEPGIVMYGNPQAHLGVPYYQEFYAGEAEDQAEVLSVNDTITVAVGFYDNCVKTRDWSALEPSVVENKYYAPGIGTVLSIMIEGGNSREELVGITDQ